VAGREAKAVGAKAADKAGDAGDATVKGAKAAGHEVADKAEDAGDQTAKGAKKSGNWLKRAFRKIF
jgi:hypothetical protein